MLKEERLLKIEEILASERFVTVERLSKLLYFSRPTIRRDLASLERDGRIRRSHGGAMLAESDRDIPISFRIAKKHSEKMQICRKALEYVRENDVIFIDGSSTCSGLATVLPSDLSLTVVTNSITVCDILSERGIRTYCTGGLLIPESRAFGGARAEEFVKSFRADTVFFSSSALSGDGVITDYSDSETTLRRAMLDCSRQKVFLCDETKFGKSAAFVLCTLHEVDYVVTDKKIPDIFGSEPQNKNIYIDNP